MFRRANRLLLEKEYQDKLEKMRAEHTNIIRSVGLLRQEIDEAKKNKNTLLEEFKSLSEENKRLSFIIGEQKKEIAENKKIINDYKIEEEIFLNKKRIAENSYKEKLLLQVESEISYKNLLSKLECKKVETNNALLFLDKLNLEINKKIEEVSLQDKKIKDISDIFSNKEKYFQDCFKKNEKEKQDNDSERTRLDIYKERLNKHYKENNINITL